MLGLGAVVFGTRVRTKQAHPKTDRGLDLQSRIRFDNCSENRSSSNLGIVARCAAEQLQSPIGYLMKQRLHGRENRDV